MTEQDAIEPNTAPEDAEPAAPPEAAAAPPAADPKPPRRQRRRPGDTADLAPLTTIVPGSWQDTLKRFAESFCRALPAAAAQHGTYELCGGEPVHVDGPDGLYRVVGQDWLYLVAAGRVVSVTRAVPPDFGGPHVIAIPNA